jgi:endonuclease III
MSTKNRGDRIQLLVKAVQKNFTPVIAPSDRSLLEHLVYACCLEDAPYEMADEAFHRLQESFFDWNEVRVTTVTELMEHLQNLPDPRAAAMRVKKNLQSLFETRYSFDLDELQKMNQGKAVAELEKLAGMSRFVLGYITQNALGGHSIPVSDGIMQVLLHTEIVSESEAAKGQSPGLDRSVPKSKGPEFASCLHQLALLVAQSPGGKQTKAILKEAGMSESKSLASPAVKKSDEKASASAKSLEGTTKEAKEAKEAGQAKAGKSPSKKAQPKKATSAKKSAPKKASAKSSPKKVAAKKATPKGPQAKESPGKRKPR